MTARAPTGYLADGLEKETSELADVLKLIDETAATLLTTLSGEWWPYVVRRRRKAKSGESVSTNTMNAFALAATAGRVKRKSKRTAL